DFTTAVALRLHLDAPEVRLMGGLFEHQKFYGIAFAPALKEKIPAAKLGPSQSSPEVGAAWLAADGKLQMPVVEKSTPPPATIAAPEEANPKSANLNQLCAR